MRTRATEHLVDVIVHAPLDLSPVLFDRFLFSLANQTAPALHLIVVINGTTPNLLESKIDLFDWSGFIREPTVLRLAKVQAEHEVRRLALEKAHGRFVSFADPTGTLYARAYEALVNEALQSRAALVYGDSVRKSMRLGQEFVVELDRLYYVAQKIGNGTIHAEALPPWSACVIDRTQVGRMILLEKMSSTDRRLRLFSRYPSSKTKEGLPIFAETSITGDDKESGKSRVNSFYMIRRLREIRRRTRLVLDRITRKAFLD